MNDVTKLPKWAQSLISELQQSQHVTGAHIENVNVETIGFKHDAHSATAITSVANALAENAKALAELSKAIMPNNVHMHVEAPAINLSNVTGK